MEKELESPESPKQRRMEHKYTDYANVNEMDLGGPNEEQRTEHNFPVRLHYMLSELEADGLDNIVSWQPHGRCFLVHNQERFVKEILPLWFRQSKFPSFQRQLNLYGFKRLTSGRDKGSYYHELFLRGKRFLACRIERIKVKGTGARKPSSPDKEPNFYLIPFVPPPMPEKKSHGNAVPQRDPSLLSSNSLGASVATAAMSAINVDRNQLLLQRLLLQQRAAADSSLVKHNLAIQTSSSSYLGVPPTRPGLVSQLLLRDPEMQLALTSRMLHPQHRQALLQELVPSSPLLNNRSSTSALSSRRHVIDPSSHGRLSQIQKQRNDLLAENLARTRLSLQHQTNTTTIPSTAPQCNSHPAAAAANIAPGLIIRQQQSSLQEPNLRHLK